MSWWVLYLLLSAVAADLVRMGCERDPSLPFCKAQAAKTHREDGGDEITDKDKRACSELRQEYVKVCAMSGHRRSDASEREFCAAFENICFRIPNGEPDQVIAPNAVIKELTLMGAKDEVSAETTEVSTPVEQPKRKKKKIDFTRFCKEFKNRYLFVCPDPFRYGQKAVVFCPIYSERCHVPLPDRPVVPTPRPPRGHRTSTVEKLCRSYRAFALNYCQNPILLAQQQYREGCERYWKFCTRRQG